MKLTHKQVEGIADTVQIALKDVEIDVNTRSNMVDPLLNDLEARLLQVIDKWEADNIVEIDVSEEE